MKSEHEIGSKIPELNNRIAEIRLLIKDEMDGVDQDWAYIEVKELKAQIRILVWALNGQDIIKPS